MRIKTVLSALLVPALFACGSGTPTGPSTPSTGTLSIRLDQQSCSGTGDITIFVDGASQGTYVFTGGATKSFTASAGQHVVGASEARTGGYVWPSQNVTVPGGSAYTLVLQCN
jgi:hypothetical protein